MRVTLTSPAAAATVGAQGDGQITFSFTIAATPSTTSATTPKGPSTSAQPAVPATLSFQSRPDLHAPVVTISKADGDPSSGYVFVDAQNAPQNGPMILDDLGNLVWFAPSPAGESALDFRVQSYHGQPVLTYWQGQVVSSGHGLGEDLILDHSYRTIATIHAGEGYQADLHEFLITSRDTALITVYQTVQADLTSVGGSINGSVFDSIIQEIDIKTGRLLWEWHALGHVPLSDSYVGKPTAGSPYDFFHINSIQETADGNLVISARNTWAVYEIERSTGAIAWELGGKESSFKMGTGTGFEWQHDARLQPDGTLTVFDDAAAPNEESQSRALRLGLDTKTMSATLLSSYTRTPSLLAGSQGSMQVLPNGNVFVGWGDQPNFSEFTPGGELIFDAKFPGGLQSYRAYRYPWTGQPAAPPSVSVITAAGGQVTAYVSWNGATEVARWQLLAGPAPDDLSPLTTVAAAGFETVISATTSLPYLAVSALDSSGQVLVTTPVTR